MLVWINIVLRNVGVCTGAYAYGKILVHFRLVGSYHYVPCKNVCIVGSSEPGNKIIMTLWLSFTAMVHTM